MAQAYIISRGVEEFMAAPAVHDGAGIIPSEIRNRL